MERQVPDAPAHAWTASHADDASHDARVVVRPDPAASRLRDNRAAIAAYNRLVGRHGIWTQGARPW